VQQADEACCGIEERYRSPQGRHRHIGDVHHRRVQLPRAGTHSRSRVRSVSWGIEGHRDHQEDRPIRKEPLRASLDQNDTQAQNIGTYVPGASVPRSQNF